MSLIRSYWALTKEQSSEFDDLISEFLSEKKRIFDSLLQRIGCDSVNENTNGSTLLTYKEKQDLPFLMKRPAYQSEDGYHYFTKGKLPESKFYGDCQSKYRALKKFDDAAKQKWPNSLVSVMSESGGRCMISHTAFGFLKGRVVMCYPADSEKPDFSKVPPEFK